MRGSSHTGHAYLMGGTMRVAWKGRCRDGHEAPKQDLVKQPGKIHAMNSVRLLVVTLLALALLAAGFARSPAGASTSITWSTSASTDPGGAANDNSLGGVSCTNRNFCVAVGAYFNGTAGQTLAEIWNGSTWSTSTTTDPGGAANDNELGGVSCTNRNFCVAVGAYFDGAPRPWPRSGTAPPGRRLRPLTPAAAATRTGSTASHAPAALSALPSGASVILPTLHPSSR